jgi:hypothetical protein
MFDECVAILVYGGEDEPIDAAGAFLDDAVERTALTFSAPWVVRGMMDRGGSASQAICFKEKRGRKKVKFSSGAKLIPWQGGGGIKLGLYVPSELCLYGALLAVCPSSDSQGSCCISNSLQAVSHHNGGPNSIQSTYSSAEQAKMWERLKVAASFGVARLFTLEGQMETC